MADRKIVPEHIAALRNILRDGRRSGGWASRPTGTSNATIRKLIELGAIEEKTGAFPVYRVSSAGHQELALRDGAA